MKAEDPAVTGTSGLAYAAVVLLWCVFAAYVWFTTEQLPERVATHFGSNGAANGWMTRGQHVGFTLVAGLMVPAFVIGLFAIIRRFGDRGLNIPNKEYWLAPERRERTFDFVQNQGFWLAVMLIGFFAAVHRSIVGANANVPARLMAEDIGWISAIFVSAIEVWIGLFLVRFLRKTV